MANIVIATPEFGDAAALTTPGTVASTLPLSNLQTQRLSQVARFTSLTDTAILVELDETTGVDLVALLATNVSEDATWRVRAATSEAGTVSAPDYDSGDMPAAPQMVLTGIEISARWVRIDIDDGSNAAGYLDLGRLYVAGGATIWRPTLNVAEGFRLGFEDDTQVAVALSGGLLPKVRSQRRVLRHVFDCQSEAEMYGQAYRLIRRGLGRDLLVVTDPEGDYVAEQTVYGLLADAQEIFNRAAELFGWQLTVRELI